MHLECPEFHRGRVLIAGDLMLDRYWSGPTSRISPEAPVPVVRVGARDDRPGGAANVALNVAALGAAAICCGVTGKDEAAQSLASHLAAAGVLADCVASTEVPTITKLRIISRNQQLLRLDFEESLAGIDQDALQERVAQQLPRCAVLVLSDYAKGTLSDPQALIHLARQAHVPVLVDPKGRDFARYRGATLLTPNLSEFEAVVGTCESEAELVARGHQLMRELELGALLITRSEKGMTLLQPDQSELHLPAMAREVYDVTGAGDTVIAVLASSLAAGTPLDQAVGLANLAASLVVGKLGTASVSGAELRAALGAGRDEAGFGVMSDEQLKIALAEARVRGERIVFTNGCFDILHAGHVGYLEQARRLGDRLVVALNSDDSVRRLKGPSRPVNPLDRRMTVIAGLGAVDYVTWFEDDTPCRLLELLQPEILVKGGDYRREEVVGWEIVEAYGGQVQVLSFHDDCSTTAIVNKIRAQDAPQ